MKTELKSDTISVGERVRVRGHVANRKPAVPPHPAFGHLLPTGEKGLLLRVAWLILTCVDTNARRESEDVYYHDYAVTNIFVRRKHRPIEDQSALERKVGFGRQVSISSQGHSGRGILVKA